MKAPKQTPKIFIGKDIYTNIKRSDKIHDELSSKCMFFMTLILACIKLI